MNPLLRALSLALLSLGWVPAQAQDVPGKLYSLGPFEQINLGGSAQVRLRQGERDEVFVEGDERVQAAVDVQLRNGTLHIDHSGGWKFWKSQRLVLRVSVRELRLLSVSGAADVLAPEPLQLKNLTVHISGAGKVQLEQLKAERLAFHVSGSGDGQMAGSVQELNVQISGRGDFSGQHLQAQVAKVGISGLGKAKVWAQQELNASVSGIGNIDYWGNPPRGQRRLAGMGSIESRGEVPPKD